MILSPEQEEFMRDFFARQQEISKESLANVTALAKANIESILTCGLISPPTIEKMEGVLDELRANKIKELAKEIQKLEEIEELKNGKGTTEHTRSPE